MGPICFKKYGLGEKLDGIPGKLNFEKYFLIMKNSFVNFSNITYEHEDQKELVGELLKLQEEGFGNDDDVEIITASNKEEAKLKFKGHSAGLSQCKACNSSYCTVFDKKFEKNEYQEESQKNELTTLKQQNKQQTRILPDLFLWSPSEKDRKFHSIVSTSSHLTKEDFAVIEPIFKHHLSSWHYIDYFKAQALAFRMNESNQEFLTIRTKNSSQTFDIQLGLYNLKINLSIMEIKKKGKKPV